MSLGRVCVTGSGGFLGSTLVGELLRYGYMVDAVDRLNYGAVGVTPYIDNKHYHFHKLDILDITEVGKVLRNADCVIHLAALVSESLCDAYPDEAWRVNVEGTHGLVELARDEHLPLILTSTCSSYGVTDGWATEATALNPKGLYAKTKVEAERLVSQLYFHVILRFATLFGVSPRMRLDLMLNEWTRDMVKKGRIEIYQPSAYRPIVHVRDASRAICAVLSGLHHGMNQVFNVGCNDYNFTKEALANIIRDEVGGEVVTVDKGDPRSYRVSFDKIRHTYGFHPETSPWAGVREVKAFLDEYKGERALSNEGDYVATGF